ncbi:Fe(2+) transporter permease subunit FeoB [Pantoea sp. ACRSH]|uniref:Fe(2+) transporter permease subunit FeoB n=1 Tax=unclassified Pantoea TaxID=2630326 RepID=UPI001EF60832|nr:MULTISPECIES: Fe(2+) transporter permease subunit FeoB [unclassified Pantoea]MCG7366265.1 Fe(2+) transporter permease subunit FeoB [Pantoea sp. ACRSH]MCG7396871.1 Fe(2+) transporter permease subunit FeoB [Pantoea sp. ACRSC]
MKRISAVLAGNPNAGKTTLFNLLTGLRQRTGNWPGVTVERKQGTFATGEASVTLIDLPGIYSLEKVQPGDGLSADERVTCSYVMSGQADVLINVVDASSLEKSLWLTLQLRELNLPMIVVLNMADVARSCGVALDSDALAAQLGCPVVLMSASTAEGVTALLAAIDSVAAAPPADLLLNRAELDAEARLARISAICQAACDRGSHRAHRLTRALDNLFLHRWLGFPLFLGVMYLMFFFSINIGGALQPVFDKGSAALFVDGTAQLCAALHFPDWLTSFLAQGIGGGITTVLPLVPQLALMFFFLTLLEESGYMARAAFVVDRLMRWLGLPGKSFVPLIVGFGCNVPAVMGARTLETERERLMTMLMAPFMSCGARLAIFAVFSGAFFGSAGAGAIFSLYLLGIAAAVLTGLVLKHTLLKGDSSCAIMELPLWHVPVMRSLLLQTWFRLHAFVIRAGAVIVAACVAISLLSNLTASGHLAQRVDDSVLASASRYLTPLFTPMGIQPDNWQATVGLVTGAMAKESVVGTLNALYMAEPQNAPDAAPAPGLTAVFASALDETWQNLKAALSPQTLFNPVEASKGDGEMSQGAVGIMQTMFGSSLAAYSYLVFVLLYVPCVSVMGALAKEAGRQWMWFALIWGTLMAYGAATLIYQIGTFTQHPGFSLLCVAAIAATGMAAVTLLRHLGINLQPALQPVKEGGCGGCKGCGH